MNEQEFLNFFRSLFDSLTENIDMDTEFRYLDEWSSLSGTMFLSDIDEKYGRKISIQEMKKAQTIGDLYKLYQRNDF